MRTLPLSLVLGAAVASTGACTKIIERDQGTVPLSFKVQVQEELGSEAQPLPYTAETRTFTLDVQAVDYQGEPAEWFDGEVYLDIAPRGRLVTGQARTITLTNGRADGVSVSVHRVHGDSSIWVEDRGTDAEPGTFATGLTPTLWVAHPTLSEVSETTNIATSALQGDFVRVNTTGRRLVATGIAVDGFYVTDLDDPTGAFNAIFAHTHSRPRGVNEGDRITELMGTVVEFYGFTEFGFPTYKVGEQITDIPVFPITLGVVADDLEMERIESRLVEVRDVTVCPLGEGYSNFGQWVVLLDPAGDCLSGSGGITIVSALSATNFTPELLVGRVLRRITGNLRYHVAARPSWIIYTRRDEDIEE